MRLSCTAPLLLALCLVTMGAGKAADIDPADVEPVGEPNAAYLDTVRWGGLQTEIVYLRPGAPLPDVEVTVPDAPWAADADAARRNWAIAAGVALLLVLAFAAWYGRGIPVSFGAPRDPLRRARGEATGAGPARDLPPDEILAGLAAMPDRRQALILLAARALERGAEANGLRLGRAQTARDVLRALPRRWPHLDTLRRLVSEAELVHFGGRDLPEERWRACFDQARPLFAVEEVP